MNDADKFLEWIEESKKLIYKVCFTYGRSESIRNDLFQEIVLQVWRSFKRYDETKKFSTWMYRIALNTAITFVRKESRRNENEVAMDSLTMDRQTIQVAVQPEAESSRDDLEWLHNKMALLDEINKAILLLKLEGKSHSEIGDVLGMSSTNVSTRLNRIKSKFQNLKTNSSQGA